MAQTPLNRLVSKKALVRVALAALSLGSMASANAQGLAAGVQAPAYGTAWAQHRSQGLSFSASAANHERADGSKAESAKVYASSRKTGNN